MLEKYPSGVCYENGRWRATEASGSEYTGWELTISAPALSLYQLEKIFTALQPSLEIICVQRHSLHGVFHEGVVCCAVQLNCDANLNDTLETLAQRYRVDIALQKDKPSLSAGGLLVMDMDSTVIQIECIDEIAKLAGLGDKVAQVTAKAMRGELDFNESLLSRVACLAGVPVAQMQQIRDGIPLMPGLVSLITILKKYGWKIAIASGGFTYFADHLKERLGLDEAFSNTLEVDNGLLTGRVVGDIVNAQAKADIVGALAQKWVIPMSQTVAMGDGANDLLMMGKAALGVACHAKPLVRKKADTAVRFGGLHTMLYLLAR
ncbi:phosphoserine phosphatase SerB [Aestuariibacter sp. A3R04]|nr:phosphoserine phosphatase SerB [Aestuariibacter sp. A3R04]